MTVDEAHKLLGVNVVETLNDIAKRYKNYLEINPNTSYEEWLEQEVIIQTLCNKRGITSAELFQILGITREDLIDRYGKFMTINEIDDYQGNIKEAHR